MDAVDEVDTVDAVDAVEFGLKRSNPHSGCSELWFKKVKLTWWMQYAVDAVEYLMVYGGGDIVFGAKGQTNGHKQMQWKSGICWWGHCFWCKKVKPVDAVNIVE